MTFLFNRKRVAKRSQSKGRTLRMESLENRELLDAARFTSAEYEAVRAAYPALDLPEWTEESAPVNVIEVSADNDGNISIAAIKQAISEAAATTADDLIVVRTTDKCNTVDYDSSIAKAAKAAAKADADVVDAKKLADEADTAAATAKADADASPNDEELAAVAKAAQDAADAAKATYQATYDKVYAKAYAANAANAEIAINIESDYGKLDIVAVGTDATTSTTRGAGADALTFDAAKNSRVFNITSGDVGLANLKITNGKIGSETSTANGGGISATGSGTRLAVSHVEISNNVAYYGGGVYLNSGAAFKAEYSNITGNSSYVSEDANGYVTSSGSGGGVYVNGSSFTAENVDICKNTTKAYGGGVYVSGSSSTFTATNVKISGNVVEGWTWRGWKYSSKQVEYEWRSGSGGGVYVNGGAAFTATDSSVSENSTQCVTIENGTTNSEACGGGVYVAMYSSFTATNVNILNNTTQASGGGVYVNMSSKFTATNVNISGNVAEGWNSSYWNDSSKQDYLKYTWKYSQGGGVYLNMGSTFTATNALITDNKATKYGSGVGASGSNTVVTVTNATIAGNVATGYLNGSSWETTYNAGVCMNSYVTFNAYNSIIVNNLSTNEDKTTTPFDIYDYGKGRCSGTNNLIGSYNPTGDNPTGEVWEGNAVYDSSITLFEEGGYTLAYSADSQAIGKGDNTKVAEIKTDLAGDSRVVNETVDLGAYEYNVKSIALNNSKVKTGETLTVVGSDYLNATYAWSRSADGKTWKNVDADAGKPAEYTVKSEDAGYTIKVEATGGYISGAPTAEAAVYESLAPAPKQTLDARTISTISVKWDAVEGASGYVIEYSSDSEFAKDATKQGTESVTGTSYTASGLDPATTYYFRVKAFADGKSDSAYSTLSAKTLETASTVVTTINESTEDDGLTSLREAIAVAGTNGLGKTITFALPAEDGNTVTIDSTLSIAKNLTINGKGVTVQAKADAEFGVFNIGDADSKISVSITGLTISGGAAENGGGVYVQNAKLWLTNATVSNNSATANGGGVYAVNSTVFFSNTKVLDNTAKTYGAGIYATDGSIVTLTRSTVTGNYLTDGGNDADKNAGVYANPAATATETTAAVKRSFVTKSRSTVQTANATPAPSTGRYAFNQATVKTASAIYGPSAMPVSAVDSAFAQIDDLLNDVEIQLPF